MVEEEIASASLGSRVNAASSSSESSTGKDGGNKSFL